MAEPELSRGRGAPTIPAWRRYLRFWRSDVARDIDDELRFHIAERVEELRSRGCAPEAAREEALREFGDLAAVRAALGAIDARRSRRRRLVLAWDAARQDLRYAVRGLRRAPGFTAAIVLTLALGIGATAAIFSIADRLFLRAPAAVVDPSTLRRLYVRTNETFDRATQVRPMLDYMEFATIRDALAARAAVAAWTPADTLALRTRGALLPVRASYVSQGYFRLLGVRATRGRLLLPDDGRMGAGERVAVLSHAYWERALARDPSVVGRALVLDGDPYTIVGIAAPDFAGLDVDAPDLWLPLADFPAMPMGTVPWYRAWHSGYYLEAVARGGPGASIAALEAAATAALRHATIQERFRDTSAAVVSGPVLAALGPSTESPPEIAISLRLTGIVVILLLIVCANVANLLLARGVRRRREIAVRLALGVSRRRLIAQLLVESLTLSTVAAGGALFVAYWGGDALRRILQPATHWPGAPFDGRVASFTLLVALATGIMAGLAPAVQATRPQLVPALGAASLGGSFRRSRLRTALIVAQAALSVVLLTGAALFVRSLRAVDAIDLGVDADRIAFGLVRFRSAQGHYEERSGHEHELAVGLTAAADRLRRLPGVESVAIASAAPLRGFALASIFVPGRDSVPMRDGGPAMLRVSPSYFAVTGVRIVRGRAFATGDANAVIVNAAMARKIWPGQDALGKCLILFVRTAPCHMVVGIAADAHRMSVVEKDAAMLYYVPLRRDSVSGYTSVIVRAPPPFVAAVVATLRTELHARFPDAEAPVVMSLAQALAPQLRPWRLGSALFSACGALALLVAAVGVYSALAYTFSQRTHEIGVRMALGANAASVVRLVVSEGLRVVALGVAAGLVLALALGRLIASLLYGVSPHDPVALGGVGLLLLAVAALAALATARRAARVDPLVALHEE